MTDMKIAEFLDVLASDSPAPGGGSASALAGAMSAALVSMVANLTIGKKKYADKEELMIATKHDADKKRQRLLELIEEDSSAFNKVMDAFRMPKGTGEEQAARNAAIQQALKDACLPPAETVQINAELMKLARIVATEGNPNAASDAGVAAHLSSAALSGAAMNVKINTTQITDKEFCKRIEESISSLKDESAKIYQEINNFLEK